MLLIFHRTGERRYAVEAKRTHYPDLEMNPAPGFDPLMPHDLLHLVVEAKLGLTRGIFGQLADGGDAGTFHPLFRSENASRTRSRISHRQKRRGKSLLRKGQTDSAQSERATYICWHEWLSRSRSNLNKQIAQSMSSQSRRIRGLSLAKELRALNKHKLDEICAQLDVLSEHWSRLAIGESFAIRWPDLAVVDPEYPSD